MKYSLNEFLIAHQMGEFLPGGEDPSASIVTIDNDHISIEYVDEDKEWHTLWEGMPHEFTEGILNYFQIQWQHV